jgi:hypothetical protein
MHRRYNMKIYNAFSDMTVAATHSVTNVFGVIDKVTSAAHIYASDLELTAQHDVAINSEQRKIDFQIAKAAHARQLASLNELPEL